MSHIIFLRISPHKWCMFLKSKSLYETFVNIPHPKVLAWYLFSKHLSQNSTEKANNGKFPVSNPAAPPVLKQIQQDSWDSHIYIPTKIYHKNQPLHVGQHIMVPWMVWVIFGVCIKAMANKSRSQWTNQAFMGKNINPMVNVQGIVGCTPTNVPLWEIPIWAPHNGIYGL